MFPIKYIDNNLVWNKDNEVFAYYELIPYNYSFLSAEQKFIVHDSFRQLIAQSREGKIHALQIATESSIRSMQEQSKKLVTGKLREVAVQKIDEQTEVLVSMIGDNQVDYRFFLGFKLMVNTGRFVVVLPDKYVQGLEVSENHLIIDTKEDTDAELENKIKEDMQHQLVKVDENGEINDESYRVNVRGAEIEQQKAMVAIVVSLFMYIAFILISAVGTILAVQSLSDSTKYKYRYLTLRRLGINDKSLFKTIRKQLLILFCVPAISAILCSFVMMSSLNNVYQQILGDKHLYLMYFGLNLIIFFLIYSIYWIATYIGFKRNINEES